MTFKPQKIQHLKEALALKTPKLQGNYMLTEKFDGWFVAIPFYKYSDSWDVPISSSGRQIPALTWLRSKLNKLPKPRESCYLLAEAIIPDTPFEIINGLLNRSVGNCECKDVIFKLHNIVFPDNQVYGLDRWKYLQEFDISSMDGIFEKIPLLYTGGYNQAIWDKYFYEVAESGGEGIVAQRETALYFPGKRNSDLLKLKLECTIDVLADRFEETIGDKGNPGLTLVSLTKNGTEIRTVISKHEDQLRFRTNPSCVLGKVVEVKGMERYSDGGLRQPVFKYIRHDKLTSEID